MWSGNLGMHDIRIAIALLLTVSLVIFVVACRTLRNRSKLFLDFLASVIVALLVTYGYLMFGQLWIVNWIPLPSVIVLSNWIPPFLAALAAVVWLRLDRASVARRMPVMVLLAVSAIYAVFYFIPKAPPECRNEWAQPTPPMVWPVCLQTTPYTCSAAAAATILNCLGIGANEQEMAELCLTRSGTTWLGLYHGLATKVLYEGYRVEFFEAPLDELEELSKHGPLLLCCELDSDVAKLVPEYVHDGGWIPGLAHSVVYFGRLHGQHVIGDPSRGYEVWEDRDLNNLWTGSGLRAVARRTLGKS